MLCGGYLGMKVIIAGSRGINDMKTLYEAIDFSGFYLTEIVSGGARGVDTLAIVLADDKKIPCKVFPAEWEKYGKSAGYKRNVVMGDYADALIAVWDGESRGTKHMIDIAKDKGLEVYIYGGK